MRRTIPLAVALLAALSAAAVCLQADESDADAPTSTWYCYGSTVILDYPYDSTGVTVTWTITPYIGETAQTEITETGTHLEKVVDNSWTSMTVKQTASKDESSSSSMTNIVLVHSDSPITVRFWSAGTQVSETVLGNTTAVQLGNMFVVPPEAPVRNGFTFVGWFTDTSCTQVFNPKTPILESIDVFAGWNPLPGGNGGITVEVGGHIVVFQPINGLEYNVTRHGADWLSFTVTQSEGHTFDMKSVKVMADSQVLTPVDNVYTIKNINKDIFVSISGIELFTIEYSLKNVTAASEDKVVKNVTASGGPFHVDLAANPDHENMTVKVFMGGKNITESAVKDGCVDIAKVTANIVIVAEASPVSKSEGFPMTSIIILIVIIIAICAVAMYLIRRHYA